MNKLKNYVANQVLTASPAELIMMLYDEGLRSLKKTEAAFAMETPDRFETINNNLLHAQAVIQELLLSLDLEKGGDLARSLSRLYDFMLRHLRHANTEKSLQSVVEIREMLASLRESWQHVVETEQESKDTGTRPQFASHHILAAG